MFRWIETEALRDKRFDSEPAAQFRRNEMLGIPLDTKIACNGGEF